MPEAEPSGVAAWQVVYIKPLLSGPGCVMLVNVDVDELQHALGGIVLEAAYMERVLRTAFSALVGSKYAAVVDGRLTAAALIEDCERITRYHTAITQAAKETIWTADPPPGKQGAASTARGWRAVRRREHS